MIINLGCGYNHIAGTINIDNRIVTKPDLVCDLSKGIPFADGSVKKVFAINFLEHIPLGHTIQMIEEIYRVLEMGGIFESFTPSTRGDAAFQDPTHLSFWNMSSWAYYTIDEWRDLYGIKAKFVGDLRDYITDKTMNAIHTHALLTKVPLPCK